MSAAPYAHQWHTKPNILGLNRSPVLMYAHLFYCSLKNEGFQAVIKDIELCLQCGSKHRYQGAGGFQRRLAFP